MPDLAVLDTLATYNMQMNELTGPLPPEWGRPGALPALTSLVVNNNQLTGGSGHAVQHAGLCGVRWGMLHAALQLRTTQVQVPGFKRFACCVLQGRCRRSGLSLGPCRASPCWPWG